jgi:ribonuclease P protein component
MEPSSPSSVHTASDARGPIAADESARIRKGRDIRAALSTGLRLHGRRVVVYVWPRDQGLRAGFICGRGVGSAVNRNRARRLLKEAWRALEPEVSSSYDVVFVARPEIRGARMGEVQSDMRGVLATAGVIQS